jgi:hypothetical protein
MYVHAHTCRYASILDLFRGQDENHQKEDAHQQMGKESWETMLEGSCHHPNGQNSMIWTNSLSPRAALRALYAIRSCTSHSN